MSSTIRPASIVLPVGLSGTYSGFPATVRRHYDGNMYEIRVPGGEICTDVSFFRIEATRPSDSFYSRVRGFVVEGYKNGFVKVNADEVMAKGSKVWEKHPGAGCIVWVKLSDIVSK